MADDDAEFSETLSAEEELDGDSGWADAQAHKGAKANIIGINALFFIKEPSYELILLPRARTKKNVPLF